MSFGLGILRLSSREFWALTPRELHRAMVAHGLQGQGIFNRADLEQLMSAFPDEVTA